MMSTLDYHSDAIAESYARALLELGEQAKCSDDILGEFQAFVALMEKDALFETFMTSAAVDKDQRAAVLEKHYRGKLSDLLLNTLQVMNRKGRAELVPLVFSHYRVALEDVRDEIDVDVTSAVALTDALRSRIAEAATQVAGRTARLVEHVDPSILGGLIVRIGDEKLDSSVSRQLGRIREAFSERASQEIHGGKAFFEGAQG